MARTSRGGFSLVEAIVALVLLGAGAAAAAAGQAWSARALARAEALEEASAAAEVILDSLAQDPAPGPGSASAGGIALEWRVTGTGAAGEVILRASARARGLGPDEFWGVSLAAPPPLLAGVR